MRWLLWLQWMVSVALFKWSIRLMPDGDTKMRLLLGAQMGLGPIKD